VNGGLRRIAAETGISLRSVKRIVRESAIAELRARLRRLRPRSDLGASKALDFCRLAT
jgi:hypothetical protein